jgi:GNAT superfamily N-acetyltransferase
MTAEIQIRLAGPEDAAAVAAVLRESFAQFRPLYTDGGFTATTPDAERVSLRMREGTVWLAVREGAVLGTVTAVVKGDSIYMRGMAVVPAARGSGTGARLLEVVERFARREGCGRIFLRTTPFLEAAIRLYEGFGFRRTDAGPHDLFGTPLFTMEKNISPAS